MRNRFVVAALLAIAAATALAGASGCKKKDDAAAGSGSATATGSGSAPGSGSASGSGTGSAAPSSNRADVAGFLTVFEPINSKLDHVSRARTACEQRKTLLDAANAIDKNTPQAGKDPQAWLETVEAIQVAIDETGDPCDNGDIKGIEAKLDAAKAAVDKLAQ